MDTPDKLLSKYSQRQASSEPEGASSRSCAILDSLGGERSRSGKGIGRAVSAIRAEFTN